MQTAILSSSEIFGNSSVDTKTIVKEARRNMCMSAGFWVRIKAGKYPYVFNKEKNTLEEAKYSIAMDSLNGKRKDVYWVEDENYEALLEIVRYKFDLEKKLDVINSNISKTVL